MITETLDFTAKKLDLAMDRDTTVDFTITYNDANGTAINLTGYTAKMDIRKQSDNSIALSLLSSAITGSRLIKNDALGTVRVLLLDNDTATLPQADYIYDLVLYSSSDVRRILAGRVLLQDVVTATP